MGGRHDEVRGFNKGECAERFLELPDGHFYVLEYEYR